MKHVLLHLSLIPQVGPVAVAKILQVLPYERLNLLYRWSLQDFMYKAGLSESLAHAIVQGLFDTKILEDEVALIAQHAIRWVTIAEEEYPLFLKNTHAPPTVLYWRGADLSILDRSIALIGSRKANLYGERTINRLVSQIVAHNWCLTSGGALGADTFVHKAALHYKGKTCAIIGSGLLVPYPASNAKLFDAIVEQGGIVMSPFPLAMQALPGNFPARNRIISGLSIATVVVQAAAKSGALITATYALEQGREVGAVPGHIDDPLSVGCHALLKEGAFLVTSVEDIFSACGIEDTHAENNHVVSNAHEKHQNNEHIVYGQAKQKNEKSDDPVYVACQTPQLFDDLCILLGYDEMRLQERLVMLQLEGLLEQDSMGRWYAA